MTVAQTQSDTTTAQWLLAVLLAAPSAGCLDSHDGGSGSDGDGDAISGDGDGDGDGGDGDGDGPAGIDVSCERHSDCRISTMQVQCCPACQPPSPGEVIAVNAEFEQNRWAAGCVDTPCPDIACQPNPARYLPECDGGTCRVVDLQTHPATECAVDADCYLRSTQCCECGAGNHLSLFAAISGGGEGLPFCWGDEACDLCIGPQPMDVAIRCNAGRCEAFDCSWTPQREGCPGG